MKKTLIFISIFVLAFVFVGCDFSVTTTSQTTAGDTTNLETTIIDSTASVTTSTETITTDDGVYDRYQEINLYSMNDFHGGTYSDIANLEEIGAFLKAEKASNENTIILSNGDIFQGAALSNYYHGEPIVEVFNEIGFDGFVIGNHEFDWGIDEVLRFTDGTTENIQMEYPLLAANIVNEDTQEPIENTVPYIIKEVSGVKVGIIGLIGNVINSISASRVENIEFLDAADTIYDYTAELRVDESCDIIVVYIHNGSDINSEIASFTGDHFVDAIFNGHMHRDEASTVYRSGGQKPLYYAQASNWDDSLFVGIKLYYDTETNEVTAGIPSTYVWDDIEDGSDLEIFNIINSYQSDQVYSDYVSEVLAVSAGYYDKYDENESGKSILTEWGATVLRDYTDIDAGALNSGGFRSAIYSGNFTMGDMIEIYPFDNYIKTCEMTGSEFEDLYNSLYGDDVVWDEGVYESGGILHIGSEPIVSSNIYTIGAVDYVFDKTYYDFLEGDNITLTTFLMRDLLVEDLRNTIGNFNPSNGTSYQDLFTIYDPSFIKDLKTSIGI
jgi:2',3'-cyclic-nucleotide 2'-phosphodiesterase (5'-nucleotidase family)